LSAAAVAATVFGPKSSLVDARTGPQIRTNYFWRFDPSNEDRWECELCESRADTRERYGMLVCPACDEHLLP